MRVVIIVIAGGTTAADTIGIMGATCGMIPGVDITGATTIVITAIGCIGRNRLKWREVRVA